MNQHRISSIAAMFLLALATVSSGFAQQQPRQPTPNDTLVSPEVHADKRVTFRIYAPKATEVTVRGDWMEGPGPVKLEKDDKGVWSVDRRPAHAGLLQLRLHGRRRPHARPEERDDQAGHRQPRQHVLPARRGGRRSRTTSRCRTARSARSGTSPSTLGTQRRMHVYTPPGYEGGKERYPVFYLLHGGGDEDSGWSTIGRAGLHPRQPDRGEEGQADARRDAQRQPAAPAPPRPARRPIRRRPAALPGPVHERTDEGGRPARREELSRSRAATTARSPGCRWAAARRPACITTHPDQFAYVAVWSAGVIAQATRAVREAQRGVSRKDADKVNKQIKLFSSQRRRQGLRPRRLEGPGRGAEEARHQARTQHQRRRPHLDQLAAVPERTRAAAVSGRPVSEGDNPDENRNPR